MKFKDNIHIPLICLAIAIFVAVAIDPGKAGSYHDEGIYIILGKALSEGKGLRLINLPSSPYQTKYPPVYPSLLSIIWRIVGFPENIFWFKLMNVVFLFLVLLETCYISLMLLGGKRLSAVIVTILVGTSTWIIFLSTTAISEMPYMFFSLAAVLILLMAEKQRPSDMIDARRYLFYSLAVFCASLAYQTRTVGLSLLLAIIIHFFIRKKYMEAAYTLALIMALNLPGLLWARAHTPGADTNPLFHYYTGYTFPVAQLNPFSGLIGYIWAVTLPNVWYLCENASLMVSNISGLFKPLIVPVMIILVAGIWKGAHKGDWLIIHLYPGVYILMFLCWPSLPTSRLRYLIPMMPFIFIIFFRGIAAFNGALAIKFRQTHRPRFYLNALLLALLLPNLVVGVRNVLSRKGYFWEGYKETITWINENTHKDAILACTYDPLYYLYTGRVVLRPMLENLLSYYYPFPTKARPYAGDPEYCFRLLKEMNVGYLIVEPLAKEEKKPVMRFYSDMVERHRDELKLVFVSKDGLHKIYQLSRADKQKTISKEYSRRLLKN